MQKDAVKNAVFFFIHAIPTAVSAIPAEKLEIAEKHI